MASARLVARIDALAWVLIYVGLLAAAVGLFLLRSDEAPGWAFVVGGCIGALAGATLIWLRSRMKDDGAAGAA